MSENNGWIKCSERMPDRDGDYLIYPAGKYYTQLESFTVRGFTFDGSTIPPNSFYFTSEDSSYGDTSSHKITPKYWQPLPQAPKDE